AVNSLRQVFTKNLLNAKEVFSVKKATLLALAFSTATIVNAQNPPEFGGRVDLGVIEHPEIVEASGLVDSRKNEHVLWTHNDRLRENALFALNTSGKHLGTYWIDGIENVDWEGLAIGPGPEPGVDYLYIGEIGNNRAPRDDIMYIYRIPEPVVDFKQSPVEITLFDVDTIAYQYPDGSRDAETLLLDPLSKDLYIVSKRRNDTGLYRAALPTSNQSSHYPRAGGHLKSGSDCRG
ncbi:hypothetical protein MYX84_05930, partial [Acidobacteria bacterium AH-259-O06]|nr:hypothetical protein [Acidobacteria bacterium AH-259-O06]